MTATKNQRTAIAIILAALVVVAVFAYVARLVRPTGAPVDTALIEGSVGSSTGSLLEGWSLENWDPHAVEYNEELLVLDARIPDGWLTYRSEAGGFEISYPPNWKVEPMMDSTSEWLDTVSQEDMDSDSWLAWSVGEVRGRIAGVTLSPVEDDYPDSTLFVRLSAERAVYSLESTANLQRPQDAYYRTVRNEARLANLRGYVTVYSNPSHQATGHLRETWVILEQSDRFYRALGVAWHKDVTTDEPLRLVDTIIGTFRLRWE